VKGKLSSRFGRGLVLLILGGASAFGVVAVPALAGTSNSTPTSTAPGVTTATPRTATTGAAPATVAPAVKQLGGPPHPRFCVKTVTGRAARCARPVAPSRRPAGARN